MDEQHGKQEKPELHQPHDSIKDLEPDEEGAEAVKGGALQPSLTVQGSKQGKSR
jgi:hypothetical protein